jgi:hypothetical protein
MLLEIVLWCSTTTPLNSERPVLPQKATLWGAFVLDAFNTDLHSDFSRPFSTPKSTA